MPHMETDWLVEMERQKERGWWKHVAGKVEGFPDDPHVYHMHPFGWVDNFKSAMKSSIEEILDEIAAAIAIGESQGYESYNAGTDSEGRVRVSIGNPPVGTVTSKTINQIIATHSLPPTDPNRLFATGKYQTIITTLTEAKHVMGLSGEEKYTPELQERIFRERLIPKAGGGALGAYLFEEKGTVDDAQYAAAKEWASIAVPAGRPIFKRLGGTISDGTLSFYQSKGNSADERATKALRSALKKIEIGS